MTDFLKEGLGPETFIVCVLWLAGWNTSSIAYVRGRTKGSIRGIVHRSLAKPRDRMTMEERQAALDHLKLTRLDSGELNEGAFRAHALDPGQKVRANAIERVASKAAPARVVEREVPLHRRAKLPEAPAPEAPQKKLSRKEQARLKKEADRQKRLEEEREAARQAGHAIHRGVRGSALEHLYQCHTLSDAADRRVDVVRSKSMASRDRRKEAGERLRAILDGCRVGGLASVDYEREVSGSGAAIAIPAYRLQCISELGALKMMMADRDYELIEGIVDRDEFPWERIPSANARSMLYEAIRRSLDVVAVFVGMLARAEFTARWGYSLVFAPSLDRDDALEVTRQARDMIGRAQREVQ